MGYKYFTCDVFTTVRFGGNPLAVLPEADGLSAGLMQQIAREFNYSESTFVTASAAGNTRKVRIYTPAGEVPFAGHPNVGTAFVLATRGEFGEIGTGLTITFEEAAGTVPVSVRRDDEGQIYCELTAPQPLTVGTSVDPARLAAILSIGVEGIVTSTHLPQVASVGLPFLIVELASREVLQRIRADLAGLEELRGEGIVPDVHAYCRSNDGFDLRARMFAPLAGVPEDPATGSANCALAALLTMRDERYASGGSWRIAQGVEMGRPSTLHACTRREGAAMTTSIGGHCVLVAEGFMEVD
jgi:trans-2,3-dihydro-3-hydroxyanthranilate isomerase